MLLKKYFLRTTLFFLIIGGIYGCSATKYVPDGEYLLDKVHIDSDIPGNKSELKPYIRQLPNFKMFNLNKTMFQLYNLSGRDSTKWINRFLKSIGDEPVIFDQERVGNTTRELRRLLVNKGYLNVDVDSLVEYNGKKVEVTYRIRGNTPYRINQLSYYILDSLARQDLSDTRKSIPGELTSQSQTLLKPGMLFDRYILDQERDRLTRMLRNRGYYDFDKSYIRYEADSTYFPNTVDLDLILSMNTQTDASRTVTEVPHRKFLIDKVDIFLDYDPLKYISTAEYPKRDSLVLGNYTLYYQGNQPSLKPSLLLNNCFISPGQNYSQSAEELTYSSFASLNALNNIHLQFREKIEGDSSLLDCTIMTIPSKKQSISFSVEGTNTSGDLGVASSVNYTHRNLFRGSESFNLRVRGAYEAISSFQNPYLELGAEASISFPKFIAPFISENFMRRMHTKTDFSLRYNIHSRPEYDRTILSGGVSYLWQDRNKSGVRHQYDLLDIDYIFLPRIDLDFFNNLPPSARLFGYTNQFIVGMSYGYYNSTFDPTQKQRTARSIRFSIESAGNFLYAVSSLTKARKNSDGMYQLLNTPYAQFVKSDFDYARTVVINPQNAFAFRVGGGIGYPYGNTKMLPFEKRYYSGGANSVRAWSVRELGPGKYVPNASTTFFNQSGDIKLDLNVEYRTRLFWKLESAVFIDAGNIWTIKDYEGQEGGRFKFNEFYKQIALGYGLGIRLDFDFFLIRLDAGWKAYDPARKGRDAWAVLHPNFTNNFAWHIAVGYPF
ncbi:outer membrane protein assembly factor [Bacteroidales bacterium OttesenSCG-928-J19]|nr:outer membrane protein assembly factor [Bacteroidales bacterium OttesenSCG-928-J19]